MGFSIIWYGPFQSGCNILEIPFCIVKLGIKINVPIFRFVAGVKREFIWVFTFRRCSNFFVIFVNFFCVFYLCLKSIRCGYRRLILNFVDNESGLHRGYVVVDYNKLNLCSVDNNLGNLMGVCCKHYWFTWFTVEYHFVR